MDTCHSVSHIAHRVKYIKTFFQPKGITRGTRPDPISRVLRIDQVNPPWRPLVSFREVASDKAIGKQISYTRGLAPRVSKGGTSAIETR